MLLESEITFRPLLSQTEFHRYGHGSPYFLTIHPAWLPFRRCADDTQSLLIQFRVHTPHDPCIRHLSILVNDEINHHPALHTIAYGIFRVLEITVDPLFHERCNFRTVQKHRPLVTIIIDEEPQGQIANYIGQALASRAFDYLQLVQAYQFTYLGHEEELAVPIVTETMSEEEAMNNPLATVKDVYTQIMSDLDTAIPYLENNPVDGDKAQINAAVAYGLRARANMLMGEYANAATDAAKALELSGATPYSIEEGDATQMDE